MWSWLWGTPTLKGGTEEEKATDEAETEQPGERVCSAREKLFLSQPFRYDQCYFVGVR